MGARKDSRGAQERKVSGCQSNLAFIFMGKKKVGEIQRYRLKHSNKGEFNTLLLLQDRSNRYRIINQVEATNNITESILYMWNFAPPRFSHSMMTFLKSALNRESISLEKYFPLLNLVLIRSSNHKIPPSKP